jgi:hypothetical protein
LALKKVFLLADCGGTLSRDLYAIKQIGLNVSLAPSFKAEKDVLASPVTGKKAGIGKRGFVMNSVCVSVFFIP